ncbi:Differentially expressed in FDCP 6-like protein [Platysternon megacephalum]|uniref:Differentially expressed in FDCP 6-like protein n=1 Tax=Platysternon megacephalum TaxID=55544 RepID=A0A4D9EA84_9SAUR|nr:Differentially expressed in FDCP 6-like protein [Platysternon megacephalum]
MRLSAPHRTASRLRRDVCGGEHVQLHLPGSTERRGWIQVGAGDPCAWLCAAHADHRLLPAPWLQARASMQAEMVLKEAEAERQRKRIVELEEMQERLQEALHQEVKARQDEESVRYAQARLLAEEEEKLKELMKLKEEQEEYIIQTQREKQVLKQEMENKSKYLEEAQKQLEEVRENRQRVDQDVMAAQRKLRQASTNVKHWNVQMNRLMHPIGPGEKRMTPCGGFPSIPPVLLTRRESSLKLRQRLEDKNYDLEREDSKKNVNNGETRRLSLSPDMDTMATESSN